jgi:hypothetical protein
MATHPIKSVFVDGVAPSKSTVRSHFMARVPLVVTNATEIQSIQVDAAVIVVVAGTGQVYRYDSTDTTSAHDGILILVDQDGKRFKNSSVYTVRSGLYTNVISREETEPPASPNDGDIYIVAVGGVDDWATHDNKIAIFAGGIWYFETPLPGALAWLQDESGYVKFNGSAWTTGISGALGVNSVRLSNLLQGANLVVTGTANAPSGGEAEGDIYIVGSSPSGDFSGFTAGRLAILEGITWTQYTPKTGWHIDDLSSSSEKRWNGSAWIAPANTPVEVAEWGPWTDTGTLGGGSGTTSVRTVSSVAVGEVGRKLEFTVHFWRAPRDGAVEVRLFRDAEGSPFYARSVPADNGDASGESLSEFVRLTVSDTNAHSYTMTIQRSSSITATGAWRVSWRIREVV